MSKSASDDWACIPEELANAARALAGARVGGAGYHAAPGSHLPLLALGPGGGDTPTRYPASTLRRLGGLPLGIAVTMIVVAGVWGAVVWLLLPRLSQPPELRAGAGAGAGVSIEAEVAATEAAAAGAGGSKRGNRSGSKRGKRKSGGGGGAGGGVGRGFGGGGDEDNEDGKHAGTVSTDGVGSNTNTSKSDSTDAAGAGDRAQLSAQAAALGGGGTDRGGPSRVGRLRVGPGILGYGSCGTIVFEGELDGRPVAVKRLLAQFYELARKELATLIASDEHPNILRCFAMEEDADFVYVALEKCVWTLASLVDPAVTGMPSASARVHGMEEDGRPAARPLTAAPVPLEAFKVMDARTGEPTREGLTIMRDVCAGLHALHSHGIVHRDLKPQNVLITSQRRGKLADMGLSKRLNLAEGTSFETHLAGAGGGGGGGSGTAGWQAPERLLHGRQARSVDTFSLGCLLHFCLTGGGHPFGERYERDANILKASYNLRAIAHLPEASDLISRLVSAKPEQRPSSAQVLMHPFWWSREKRLLFLNDLSDRLEMEDREAGGPALLAELEHDATRRALGGGDWEPRLDAGLRATLGHYRRYKAGEVRDLLRVIRNKMNHFRELPPKVQKEVGAPPDKFYEYFASRFPGLLMHTYWFAYRNCAHEPQFQKFFFPEGSERNASDRSGGGGGIELTVDALQQVAVTAAGRSADKASRHVEGP